jgi:hypothetical protein
LVNYRQLMALKRKVSSAGGLAFKSTVERKPASASSRAIRWRGITLNFVPRLSEYTNPGIFGPRLPAAVLCARGRDEASSSITFTFNGWRMNSSARWRKARAGGTALYLDFPLGVNRDGYDVWRERAIFALDADGGAPPDGLFIKGQNWGFPPLHPEALRRQGYRYYIQCLRHHLRYAGLLRLDHVMGLHRSYWIPRGFAACEGVYVHHRPDEFYAIVSLESHRQRTQIAGEISAPCHPM